MRKLFLFLPVLLLTASTVSDNHGTMLLGDYPAVKIGDQIWMSFNWDVRGPKSWFFENDSINNKEYGRLYYYSNAMIAPPGWHLPSLDEWQQLINFYGGDEKALPHLLVAALWIR